MLARTPFRVYPLPYQPQPRPAHQTCTFLPIQSITDATLFQSTGQAKSIALDQLRYTLYIAEDNITKHTEYILKSLVKISGMSEEIPEAT
jgi:hypothetical protein